MSGERLTDPTFAFFQQLRLAGEHHEQPHKQLIRPPIARPVLAGERKKKRKKAALPVRRPVSLYGCRVSSAPRRRHRRARHRRSSSHLPRHPLHSSPSMTSRPLQKNIRLRRAAIARYGPPPPHFVHRSQWLRASRCCCCSSTARWRSDLRRPFGVGARCFRGTARLLPSRGTPVDAGTP